MNNNQFCEQSKNFFPTLTQLAAVEVFNIVFNIYFIIDKHKHTLFFCFNDNGDIKCLICRISLFSFGWFKNQGRRDRKYLINFCIKFLKSKQKILEKTVYKMIYFNNDYEYTFFFWQTT